MSKNRNKDIPHEANPIQKKRWLNIGPGIVIALAISAFIGSQWINTEMKARQQKNTPPILERQVISSSYEEKSGPIPEVSFIINKANELQITSTQLSQLKKLQTEWQKVYGPRIAAANEAIDTTNKYFMDAKDRSRTPIAQIQNAAAPVIALSSEISAARRSYWTQATKILSLQQRKSLQVEREADWKAKLDSLSKKVNDN